MKRGFALVTVLVIIGVLGVIATSFVLTRGFFENPGENRLTSIFRDDDDNNDDNAADLPISTPAPSGEPSTIDDSGDTSASTIYTQPQNVYTIMLPGGWSVASTFATANYSTTKFVGAEGSISITFGDGKDPIGGCSEVSNIVLADRTIAGCFLLQRDGSRILTRAYTRDVAGLPITVEANINTPLAINQPDVMAIVKTIDIK